ncbi:DNA repair protein RecN [Amnibacterium kyonggiense]|uniref:DNA repair protein RecN n=1 Tax=Amnibacterium kyonggiense TaxID=595671 RepID=A0A4R7FK98_9MICO|nr:DNA repair protein RecN [Amnibacterium kyonggiense]TDS76769.1 DNA replication and repair protein RecN [Amnibacterium kyonggiense]
MAGPGVVSAPRPGIEEITIRGIGVIEDAVLPLGPGFTALTGETGAGKTMVVTALGLLLGGRADSGVLRAGAERAVAEARWIVPAHGAVADRVDDAGGELEPIGEGAAELLVSRTLSAEGRSRVAVAGRSVPVGVLQELGEDLVAVHGQSEQLRLKSPVAQRELLDRFAGGELAAVLEEYAAVHRRLLEDRAELDRLTAERDARAAEAEELRIALAEIEEVAPQPGEDAELAALAERLGAQDELRVAAATAHEALSSEDVGALDALTLLVEARRALERAAPIDPELAALAETVASVASLAADASADLASYLAALDPDAPGRLEGVQQRIGELNVLLRKHGPTLDDVLATAESGSRRLLELDADPDRLEALAARTGEAEREASVLADRMTALRRDAADRLGAAVTAELGDLAMGNSSVLVEVTSREELTATGRDAVQLLLRAYPGAEPRPIARGASGGELSRVMLALEVVLAGTDPVPTFVFDEVDAGIGGAAATEVGKRLARLATTSQVIAVTHLAQVAAFATNHLKVLKGSDGGVTTSTVQRLTGDERVAEMARLLSGLTTSDSALAHARELLDLAGTA